MAARDQPGDVVQRLHPAAVRVVPIEGGEPVGGRPVEAGAGHVERSEDPVCQEHVERRAARDLDDPGQHIGRAGVVPRRPGLEQQRQFRRPVAEFGERVGIASAEHGDPGGPVGVVDRITRQAADGQTGRMGEQVVDPDRLAERRVTASRNACLEAKCL
ncbi:hypothetical protein GCM10009534_16950 [Kribbella sandramycini]|uniref:Uncharacterized protein n=1 Tax=Kribbella sandramycini TaxID=60450 RepID=A0A841SJJ6_9ACTN|nr:hypothetical protein [Kribbella sandramycini]MBB6569740.1 hypothetical protein [Kribbella sandramycini]